MIDVPWQSVLHQGLVHSSVPGWTKGFMDLHSTPVVPLWCRVLDGHSDACRVSVVDSELTCMACVVARSESEVASCRRCGQSFVWWLHPVPLCEDCVESAYLTSETCSP